MTIDQIIEKRLIPSTHYIYGFANLKDLLPSEYIGYPYGISIGKRLDDTIIDSIENGPTVEYLDHYKAINNELNNLTTNICDELKEMSVNCTSIVPTIPTTSEEFKPYLQLLKYPISHKMVATRAGLGWIGKTDLFISNEFGPRVRLVSILIDRPVEIPKQTIDKSKCGKCDICVKRCPAQAANGIPWDIKTDRGEFFDAHACRNKCGELAKKLLNMDSRVCGICISVCPIGQKNKIG